MEQDTPTPAPAPSSSSSSSSSPSQSNASQYAPLLQNLESAVASSQYHAHPATRQAGEKAILEWKEYVTRLGWEGVRVGRFVLENSKNPTTLFHACGLMRSLLPSCVLTPLAPISQIWEIRTWLISYSLNRNLNHLRSRDVSSSSSNRFVERQVVEILVILNHVALCLDPTPEEYQHTLFPPAPSSSSSTQGQVRPEPRGWTLSQRYQMLAETDQMFSLPDPSDSNVDPRVLASLQFVLDVFHASPGIHGGGGGKGKGPALSWEREQRAKWAFETFVCAAVLKSILRVLQAINSAPPNSPLQSLLPLAISTLNNLLSFPFLSSTASTGFVSASSLASTQRNDHVHGHDHDHDHDHDHEAEEDSPFWSSKSLDSRPLPNHLKPLLLNQQVLYLLISINDSLAKQVAKASAEIEAGNDEVDLDDLQGKLVESGSCLETLIGFDSRPVVEGDRGMIGGSGAGPGVGMGMGGQGGVAGVAGGEIVWTKENEKNWKREVGVALTGFVGCLPHPSTIRSREALSTFNRTLITLARAFRVYVSTTPVNLLILSLCSSIPATPTSSTPNPTLTPNLNDVNSFFTSLLTLASLCLQSSNQSALDNVTTELQLEYEEEAEDDALNGFGEVGMAWSKVARSAQEFLDHHNGGNGVDGRANGFGGGDDGFSAGGSEEVNAFLKSVIPFLCGPLRQGAAQLVRMFVDEKMENARRVADITLKGKEKGEEVDVEDEEAKAGIKDHNLVADLLSALSFLGRLFPMQVLSDLHQRLTTVSARMLNLVHRDAHPSDTFEEVTRREVELGMVNEQTHWILLVAGSVLAYDATGELSSAPKSIIDESSRTSTEQDFVVQLPRLVLHVMESLIVQQNSPAMTRISPQVVEDLIWFVSPWAPSYLLVDPEYSGHVSPNITAAFSGEAGQSVLGFILNNLRTMLQLWSGETDIRDQIMQALVTWSRSTALSSNIVGSEAFGALVVSIMDGASLLPEDTVAGLTSAIVGCVAASLSNPNALRYFETVLAAAERRMSTVLSNPQYAEAPLHFPESQRVETDLEMYTGILASCQPQTFRTTLEFSLRFLPTAVRLIQTNVKDTGIVSHLLDFLVANAKVLAEGLGEIDDDSTRQILIHIKDAVGSYAVHFANVTSADKAGPAERGSVSSIRDVLDHLTFYAQTSEQTRSLASIACVPLALHIIPLFTKSILAQPVARHNFMRLLARLLRSFANELAAVDRAPDGLGPQRQKMMSNLRNGLLFTMFGPETDTIRAALETARVLAGSVIVREPGSGDPGQFEDYKETLSCIFAVLVQTVFFDPLPSSLTPSYLQTFQHVTLALSRPSLMNSIASALPSSINMAIAGLGERIDDPGRERLANALESVCSALQADGALVQSARRPGRWEEVCSISPDAKRHFLDVIKEVKAAIRLRT